MCLSALNTFDYISYAIKKNAFPNLMKIFEKKMGWPEVCRPNQPIFVKYLMLGISNFFNCIADVANYVGYLSRLIFIQFINSAAFGSCFT